MKKREHIKIHLKDAMRSIDENNLQLEFNLFEIANILGIIAEEIKDE